MSFHEIQYCQYLAGDNGQVFTALEHVLRNEGRGEEGERGQTDLGFYEVSRWYLCTSFLLVMQQPTALWDGERESYYLHTINWQLTLSK